jgi:hypothetical protein
MVQHNSPFLSNVRPDPNPILVEMPNRTYATSTHIAEFNNPNMPMGARTIRLFPHLKEFLMALGIFCDNGCTATFTKDKCYIYDITGRQILTGSRNRATNCWATTVKILVQRKFTKLNDYLELVVPKKGGLWTHTGTEEVRLPTHSCRLTWLVHG